MKNSLKKIEKMTTGVYICSTWDFVELHVLQTLLRMLTKLQIVKSLFICMHKCLPGSLLLSFHSFQVPVVQN